MQNASSDVFFNSCLNQKEKCVLRLELDSGESWLRAGGCEAPDFSRAGSEQTLEKQFIFSSFLFSLSHFPPIPSCHMANLLRASTGHLENNELKFLCSSAKE